MKLNKREMLLASATLLVVLLTITYLVGRNYFAEWREMSSSYDTFSHRIKVAETQIAQKDKWFEKLAEVQQDLPSYELGKDTTSEMMKMLEQLASQHGLVLGKRSPGEEVQLGQLYQFSIECTWEGSLESLVQFLYAVQTKGAILDVRQLSVSPAPGKPDSLKGGFTVDYAYSRLETPAAAGTNDGG